jgi:hypothetical protein
MMRTQVFQNVHCATVSRHICVKLISIFPYYKRKYQHRLDAVSVTRISTVHHHSLHFSLFYIHIMIFQFSFMSDIKRDNFFYGCIRVLLIKFTVETQNLKNYQKCVFDTDSMIQFILATYLVCWSLTLLEAHCHQLRCLKRED